MPGFSDAEAWQWDETGSVAAPIDTYDRDLPLMCAMIRSYKVDGEKAGQVLKARADAAHQNMHIAAMQFQEFEKTMARLDAIRYEQGEQTARQNAINHQNYMDEQGQKFAAVQAAHDAQMSDNDAHNRQEAVRQWHASQASADLQELVGGTSTIVDTRTGESGTAGYHDVDGIVNHLNQATLDPDRFVHVPLRDQLYPAPAGQ